MKGNIKRLCVITPNYPTLNNPVYTFVDNLVCEIVDQGIECVVISPQSITKNLLRKEPRRKKIDKRTTIKGNEFYIYSPNFISYSNKKILNIKLGCYTQKNYVNTVIKEFNKRGIDADAVYGHFIGYSGIAAVELGNIKSIPSFIANGESSLIGLNSLCTDWIKKSLKNVNGIISVSTKNKNEILKSGYLEKKYQEKIKVIPNAIDSNKFYKIDRIKARNELGISEDAFIVAFTGSFSNRKGSGRLSKAIDKIDEDVYSIFIGSGDIEPNCKNIIYKGRVDNHNLYKYLNASDIFVLPTLAEGCCNAIIEAMACGLPIISSNKEFNDDILKDNNSLRIDSNNVEQIKSSILKLKNDKDLRKTMSLKSLNISKDLNIENRAKKIIEFINENIMEKTNGIEYK